MPKDQCPICQQLIDCRNNNYPLLIREFPHSYFVLGQHQFYNGYCLLLAKTHVREMHTLSADVQQGLAQELMLAGKAVATTFTPWKMNYASYGNVVEHLHWHIIPRYADDPKRQECPFTRAAQFEQFLTQPQDAEEKIRLLKLYL